jgi:hypothetical protein
MRLTLLKRQDYRCALCHVRFDPDEDLPLIDAHHDGIVTVTWIGRAKTLKGRKPTFYAAFRTHVSWFQTSNALVR